MLYYCNMVRWAWLDWGLSWWLTTLLQCFDTVGWVVRPVKQRLWNDLNCVAWHFSHSVLCFCRLSHSTCYSCLAAVTSTSWLNSYWRWSVAVGQVPALSHRCRQSTSARLFFHRSPSTGPLLHVSQSLGLFVELIGASHLTVATKLKYLGMDFSEHGKLVREFCATSGKNCNKLSSFCSSFKYLCITAVD